MNIKRIFNTMTADNRRVLIVLLAFSAILMLAVLNTSKSVYASSPVPQRIVTGGGGGVTPVPDTIYGQLQNTEYPYTAPANELVSIGWFTWTMYTYTDSNGVFVFNASTQNLPINQGQAGFTPGPNTQYEITVNGDRFDKWNWLPDYTWGQWDGYVTTDNNGWAQMSIPLEPAVQVNVTYAAMYSDTKYATLQYGIGSESSFSHSVSLNVLNNGISVAYTKSSSLSTTLSVSGVSCYQVTEHWYANSYYENTVPGVIATGLSVQVPYTGYFCYPTTEYINPSTITSDYLDFGLGGGGQISETYNYQETGSYTWGVNGAPFAIVFSAWSQLLTIDETVTTTQTSDMSFTVAVPAGSPYMNFMAYCPSNFNPQAKPNIGTGGFELHVWDMSDDG